MTTSIYAPMVAMWILTVAVWFYMYSRRLPYLLNLGKDINKISKREIEVDAPRHVVNPSDNLKNLFEMPVLFYAVVLYVGQRGGDVSAIDIGAAWAFVGFRLVHSVVHCSFNHIQTRFYLYLGASFALFFLIARAAMQLVSTSAA